MDDNVTTGIIIHLPTEWKVANYRYAFQALAVALPPHAAVLCVNRPVDPVVTPLKHPRKFCEGIWRTRVEHIAPRMLVITPRLIIHENLASRLPGMTEINQQLMRVQLRGILQREFPRAQSLIQWIPHAIQRWIFGVFPDAGRVYQCYDEYCCSPDGTYRPRDWENEKILLREADLTFVTSEPLWERRAPFAQRAVIMPNGVPEFFFDTEERLDDPIDALPQPRIGYLGRIYEFFEADLLVQIFAERRSWHLVLVSPTAETSRISRLLRLPNVHLAGPRPHERLPAILRRFRVGLMPFAINDYTRATAPHKLYEYMAAGLPVVSSALPQLEYLQSLIRLVPNTPQAFDGAIESLLNADRQSLAEKLRAEARRRTWARINAESVVPALREVFEF